MGSKRDTIVRRRLLPRRSKLVSTGIAIAVFGAHAAYSQESTDHRAQELNVGVYIDPPFVEQSSEGTYSGMAIDLWETIAERIGVYYRYISYPTIRDLVEATANGEVDAAVTNVTITQNRAEDIAFTQPWYDAGLRIMVPSRGGGGLRGFIAGLADAGHLRVYAWILLLVTLATVGLTLIDRRFDAEFPKRWREGIAESFYHVMSIVTSGRAPHKNLFGWVGRIIAGIWLLFGIAVVAYVVSSLTSVMTTVSLTRSIHSLSDLRGHTVAVRAGSVAEDYVRRLGIASRPYPDIDESVDALAAGKVDAIVADAPTLEHYTHTHTGKEVVVVGHIFHPDKYGFAFPRDSELTHRVTLEILELREDGTIENLRRKYFGQAH